MDKTRRFDRSSVIFKYVKKLKELAYIYIYIYVCVCVCVCV